MDDWTNELRGIDTDFRNRIENAIRDLEREETERHLMEQQEIEMHKAIAREKREAPWIWPNPRSSMPSSGTWAGPGSKVA